jgi:predicted regulator of amino acid metabolism with ACT domain
MDLAPVLDLTVLTITVSDAESSGIVAAVTDAIARADITIRQVISDDPEFSDEPKLYIITAQELPGELINEIRSMEFVRKIELQ